MPRKSIADTLASKQRILNSAALLMRQRGYDGVGVDEIMAHAGLTAGAFYTHFESKLALFNAVVAGALVQAERFLPTVETEGDIERFTQFYLSDSAVRELGAGCVVAAMSADLTRHSEAAREAASAYILLMQKRIAKALRPRFGAQANEKAWHICASLVGALILTRIVQRPSVTKSVTKQVKNQIALRR